MLTNKTSYILSGGIFMKILSRKKLFIVLLLIVATSCVTINIYFPEAAVEKAADRIVDEVWGEKGIEQPKQEEQKPEGEPQSFIHRFIKLAITLIGPQDAYAQDADINVTTPAIRALKDSIQQRAGSLKPYLDKGNVGITNDGLLSTRSLEGLNLKEKATLKRYIEAENTDRNTLYAEIAKANNFPPDRIADIKAIFAKSWINQAKGGWWIQNPDGGWVQK
jgi:uncharacterized protein YdbL (DUF1318 family)